MNEEGKRMNHPVQCGTVNVVASLCAIRCSARLLTLRLHRALNRAGAAALTLNERNVNEVKLKGPQVNAMPPGPDGMK